MPNCPLCLNSKTFLYYHISIKNLDRDYFKCPICSFVFVPSYDHLSNYDQMSRYLNHRNDPQDLHYRNFLTPIKTAMLPYLKPGQNGLDFGSGPGPTLSVMFQEEGYKMETFDLFFNNDEQTLKHKYDFIVSTETVEHFDNPMKEFVLLSKLLKSKGTLGIMTSILYRHIKFSDWYYILDPTHVGFYSPETFEYIGNLFKYTLYTPTDNVYIFTKNV